MLNTFVLLSRSVGTLRSLIIGTAPRPRDLYLDKFQFFTVKVGVSDGVNVIDLGEVGATRPSEDRTGGSPPWCPEFRLDSSDETTL